MSSEEDHRIIHSGSQRPNGYTGVRRTRRSRGAMSGFHSTFDHSAFLFWLALAVILVLVAVWTARTRRSVQSLEARIDDLFGGLSSENTARMLTEYLTTVRSTAAAVSRIQEEHGRIAAVMPGVVRHVGLVRFSPFHDTGGDQSFALALLDGKRDGVVVTGLHSRSDSRLYAKPIQGGSSEYSLTPEEREAMNRALHGNPVQASS